MRPAGASNRTSERCAHTRRRGTEGWIMGGGQRRRVGRGARLRAVPTRTLADEEKDCAVHAQFKNENGGHASLCPPYRLAQCCSCYLGAKIMIIWRPSKRGSISTLA